MNQIRGATLGDGGHAAFASILWSPPLKVMNVRWVFVLVEIIRSFRFLLNSFAHIWYRTRLL